MRLSSLIDHRARVVVTLLIVPCHQILASHLARLEAFCIVNYHVGDPKHPSSIENKQTQRHEKPLREKLAGKSTAW
jgi:hypothetical protein